MERRGLVFKESVYKLVIDWYSNKTLKPQSGSDSGQSIQDVVSNGDFQVGYYSMLSTVTLPSVQVHYVHDDVIVVMLWLKRRDSSQQ